MKIEEIKFKGKIINLSKSSKGVSVPKAFIESEILKLGQEYEIVIREKTKNGINGIQSWDLNKFGRFPSFIT